MFKKTDDVCCRNCVFWEDETCHRNAAAIPPPGVVEVLGSESLLFAFWPETLTDDWCGEFQHREASEEPRSVTEISTAAKEAEAKIDAGIKEAFDTGDWPDGFDIAAIVQEAINNSVSGELSE